MEQNFHVHIESFRKEIKMVDRLIQADRQIVDFCVESMKTANEKFKKSQISNKNFLLDTSISQLEKIRDNESLKETYKIVLNQSIVLLVSYFTATLEKIFKTSCAIAVRQNAFNRDSSMKVFLNDLILFSRNPESSIGDIILKRDDTISFQDMKSVYQTFNNYFGFAHEKDQDVNTVIMGQACRHIMVHAGGRVTEKLLNQVAEAQPRKIKHDIRINEEIEFSEEEIKILTTSMMSYLKRLTDGTKEALKKNTKELI
jgi:hypothetical protein